jgi:pimeloyl-ACP methyl ester carboxylesterase
MTPERCAVPVDGGVLEVFTLRGRSPAICTTHPFIPRRGNSPDSVRTSAYLQALAAAGTLVVVNPRGMGGSSPVRDGRDVRLECLVDDLEAVRAALGIERWVFAGGSSGGDVGLLYALERPAALAGLMVFSTAPDGRAVLGDERSLASPRHPRWAGGADLRGAAPLRVLPSALGIPSGRWEQVRPDLWRYAEDDVPRLMLPSDGPREDVPQRQRAALEEFAAFDATNRLGEIRVPTLVVCGRRDELIPACRCELLGQIPGATLVVLEESGHDLDEVGRFRECVGQFMARLGEGG